MAINVKRNSLAKQIAKRRWLRRLPWFDLPARAFIETDNARLFVDLGDWHGPSYHLLNWGLASYEPDNLRFLEQCLALNPEGVFFDVGANIGIFAFQLARKFPGLTVHAFEPDQTNVDCLNETFARNAFPHVNVHQLALSEKKGEAIFYADEDNHGGHSLNELDSRRGQPCAS
ncbi:MAG: FkbM family methyltransferase [Acidobacteriota bacterium]|nr:FkbM family methyltransferase [Acidobacteriota bacterium]